MRITIAIIYFLCILISFLPSSAFPKANLVRNIEKNEINKIQLIPSEPSWKVNLTSHVFTLNPNSQIDSVMFYLQNAEVLFPTHPTRIWECNLALYLNNGEIKHFSIRQTNNNGTTIDYKDADYRNDLLGKYLEKITNFKEPQYGAK